MKTKLIGILLLLASLIPLVKGIDAVYTRYKPATSVTFENKSQNIKKAQRIPVKLTLESINLISPITTTKDIWIYPENSLVYLENSALPGETGNTVIYGHNYTSLLGNLTTAKLGDSIELDLSTGEKITYVISNKYSVTPDQTHILNPTSDSRLTLFTCSGFLDSKRLVVIAKQISQ